MDGNDQGGDEGMGCCCCRPMMEENDELKKYKPILIAGIIIYSVVCLLDSFYLSNWNLFSYVLLIVCLCLMIFNRCYIAFQFYTLLSVIMLFQVIIPNIGIPLQSKFKSENAWGSFVIYLITFIFYFFYFYYAFKAYKEMKYIFTSNMGNRPQLSNDYVQSNNDSYGYGYGYSGNNNNYNSNNNTSSTGGFKAFSGKGYTVGGS